MYNKAFERDHHGKLSNAFQDLLIKSSEITIVIRILPFTTIPRRTEPLSEAARASDAPVVMKWPRSLSRLQYSRVESNVKTSSKVPNSTYPVRYTVYACQLPNSVNTSVEMAGGCQTGRGRYVLRAGRRGQSRTPAEGPCGQRGGAGLGSPRAAGGRTESDFLVKRLVQPILTGASPAGG